MSGLAALLAGRKDPGIYHWHGAFDAADVRHTVEHAGWHFAHLDGWHFETKKEFLVSVGEALGFPDYYGQELRRPGRLPPATSRRETATGPCCCGTAGGPSPATTSGRSPWR